MKKRLIILPGIPRKLDEQLSKQDYYSKITRCDYKYGTAPFVFDLDGELFKTLEPELRASHFWEKRDIVIQVTGKDILTYPFYYLRAKDDREKESEPPKVESYGSIDEISADRCSTETFAKDWQQQPLNMPTKHSKTDIFQHYCVGTEEFHYAPIYVSKVIKEAMEAESFTGVEYRACSDEAFYQLVPTVSILRSFKLGDELPMEYVPEELGRFSARDLQDVDFQETSVPSGTDLPYYVEIIVSARVMKFLRDHKVKGLEPLRSPLILPKGLKLDNQVVPIADSNS